MDTQTDNAETITTSADIGFNNKLGLDMCTYVFINYIKYSVALHCG